MKSFISIRIGHKPAFKIQAGKLAVQINCGYTFLKLGRWEYERIKA